MRERWRSEAARGRCRQRGTIPGIAGVGLGSATGSDAIAGWRSARIRRLHLRRVGAVRCDSDVRAFHGELLRLCRKRALELAAEGGRHRVLCVCLARKTAHTHTGTASRRGDRVVKLDVEMADHAAEHVWTPSSGVPTMWINAQYAAKVSDSYVRRRAQRGSAWVLVPDPAPPALLNGRHTTVIQPACRYALVNTHCLVKWSKREWGPWTGPTVGRSMIVWPVSWPASADGPKRRSRGMPCRYPLRHLVAGGDPSSLPQVRCAVAVQPRRRARRSASAIE